MRKDDELGFLNDPETFAEPPPAPDVAENPMKGWTLLVMVVGLALVVIGVIGLVVACNIDTTVAVGEYRERVHNEGLIENRRFGEEVFSDLVIAGSVLFGCAFVARTVLSVADSMTGKN